MASGIYNRAKANLMNALLDLEGSNIKVMLLNNSHAFTATHNVKGDVDTNDIGSQTVYVAGGSALANPAVTQGATTKWDADNHAYGPGESLTAYHAVLWDDDNATDDLICSFDFGGAKTVSNGTLTIEWHTNGIITLT